MHCSRHLRLSRKAGFFKTRGVTITTPSVTHVSRRERAPARHKLAVHCDVKRFEGRHALRLEPWCQEPCVTTVVLLAARPVKAGGRPPEALIIWAGPRGCGIAEGWVCEMVARAFSKSGACLPRCERDAFPRGACIVILLPRGPLHPHRGSNLTGAEITLL